MQNRVPRHRTKTKRTNSIAFLSRLREAGGAASDVFTYANRSSETRHQFVTKTRSFRDIFALVRTGKARQAKGFSFLTTQLTRWRPAVRTRTGLPYFSITSRLATAFGCCFATWFASHLLLHIKDRLALVRPRAVASVTPTQRAGGPIERSACRASAAR
jgi:hypothetical protein